MSEYMVNKNLVIIGAGEFGHIAYEYFTHDSDYTVVAFAIEQAYITEKSFQDLPVIPLEELQKHYTPADVQVYVAVTNVQLNRARKRLYQQVKNWGYTCASYVSSQAFVWRNAKIGENTFVFEHNTIQPFVEIGNNVVLWSGNHIGHRTVVHDHCFITSHCVISGYCEIGEHSFLGVNSCFANNLNIAEDNFIAMGAVVTKNTQPNGVYKGHPAVASKITATRLCKVKE